MRIVNDFSKTIGPEITKDARTLKGTKFVNYLLVNYSHILLLKIATREQKAEAIIFLVNDNFNDDAFQVRYLLFAYIQIPVFLFVAAFDFYN